MCSDVSGDSGTSGSRASTAGNGAHFVARKSRERILKNDMRMTADNVPLINVAACCDEAYAKHCAVMLTSLFHNNARRLLRVFILTKDLSPLTRQRLAETARNRSAAIEFIDIDDHKLKDCKVSAHASVANYYRLLIPEVLDPTLERVIYLDCDLIVRKDILRLWQVDLTDCPLGAVEAWDCAQHPLLLPEGATYFNSGVIVLDLKKWRQRDTTDKLLEYMRQNQQRIKWWDQDVLNAVLYDQRLLLHPTWNVNFQVRPRDYSRLSFRMQESDYLATLRDPAIYHFAGRKKPWHYVYVGPFADEYFRYLNDTSWSGAGPEGVSARNFLKKWFLRSLFFLGIYEPMAPTSQLGLTMRVLLGLRDAYRRWSSSPSRRRVA